MSKNILLFVAICLCCQVKTYTLLELEFNKNLLAFRLFKGVLIIDLKYVQNFLLHILLQLKLNAAQRFNVFLTYIATKIFIN